MHGTTVGYDNVSTDQSVAEPTLGLLKLSHVNMFMFLDDQNWKNFFCKSVQIPSAYRGYVDSYWPTGAYIYAARGCAANCIAALVKQVATSCHGAWLSNLQRSHVQQRTAYVCTHLNAC